MKKTATLILTIALLATCTAASALEGPTKYVSNVDTVQFGHYEQDNNPDNGPEPIRWIVLEERDGKRLLFAKDLLDQHRYNTKYGLITWEDCELRTWLNHDFLNTAFTEAEQAAILLTDVDNSHAQDDPSFRTTSGNDTQDKIFLRSFAEANKYLGVTYENGDNAEARVAPTAFAKGRRAWSKRELKTADGDYAGRWWLRSMGRHPNRAAHVHSTGALRDSHVTSYNHLFGVMTVRPALWVKAEAVSGK